MVAPEFSEFQFAYGMTRELDNGRWPLRPTGIPFFPTQPQENDLGFDMGVSGRAWTLFVQFKRSKMLTRPNAREWDWYHGEYFRFPVDTSDDPREPAQHETLVRLGQLFPHTYYVAPEFVEWRDYARHARRERINRHAAFLKCGTAPTPFDGDDHHICYRPRDSFGRFFSETSEPGKVEVVHWYDRLFGNMVEDGPEYESFQTMRGDFTEARDLVVEEWSLGADPDDYSAEEPEEWMREQQRFFYETLGSVLYFLTDPSKDQD